MSKVIIGFTLLLLCCLFNCTNDTDTSVIDYDPRDKYIIVLEHLKKDSTFLMYADSYDLSSSDIHFDISSRNIYPTLFCFKGLINYKKKLDKTFNEDVFKSILEGFTVKQIKLNKTQEKRKGPFKIYFTYIQDDIFCQVYFDNGHNLWERDKYIEYLGASLGYYFVFTDQGKIDKSFVCSSDHG